MLLLTSFFFLGCSRNSPITTTVVTTLPNSESLFNGVASVKPGESYNVKFTVETSTMLSVAVTGTFQASGGSGNDIKVFILSDIDYLNWSNGHSFSALYSSGQLTAGNINSTITKSGTYYLVFSNDFSIISTKSVTAKIDMKWSQTVTNTIVTLITQ